MRPPLRPLIAFVALVALAGCRQEPTVESYTVDYPERTALRVLGAIVPHGEKVWYFKLFGPADAVDKQKKAFDDYLASVSFDDKKEPPLEGTAPAGWRHEPGAGMRAATYKIDAGDRPLEMTVFAFEKEQNGSVLDNVNRWRKQVALPPLGDLEGVVRRKVGGEPATVIDATGLGTFKEAKAAPKAALPDLGAPPPREKAALPFAYDMPKGWRRAAENKPLSVETLAAGDNLFVTVTPLSKAGGDLVPNVNRWRGQVGLKQQTEAEVLKDTREMKIDGLAASLVDLDNPESKGPAGRILGLILPAGETTWFFKMTGPSEAVGRHKAEFESFVGSLKRTAK